MTIVLNGTTGITSVNGSAAAPSVTGTDTDTGIVYGTNTLSLVTGGTTAMTIDSSQGTNFAKPIGLTVTPSAPGFPFNNAVIQSPTYTAYSWTSNGSLYLQTNAYYSGGWKYQQAAINPTQVTISGGFDVGSSATGSADAAITWTSMLGVSGLGKTVYLEGGTQSLAGTGITFPATQNASSNANTLDDYEEGTFTPTMRGAGTAGTYTGTSSGIYTKIGRQVTVYISFSPSTTASGGTNYMQITGLPFTNANQANGALQMTNVNMSDTAKYWVVQFISSSGQNTIYVSEIYDNSGTTDLSIGGFGTSSSISISLTYFTST